MTEKVKLVDIVFEASCLILVGLGIAFLIVIGTIDDPNVYGPNARMLQSLVIVMGIVMGICAVSTLLLERSKKSKFRLTK